VLPAARTRDEAQLYMDLHGCPRCGSPDTPWAEALIEADGALARRYHGVCAGCGDEREFVFALPEVATPPAPGARVTFGPAGSPSVLLDAGEWVTVGDMMALAADVPGVPADEVRESAGIGVACFDEALKFVPAGAGEVPDAGFFTDRGREFRDRAPGRFRRSELESRRADLARRG
jgi:hypothetical protein